MTRLHVSIAILFLILTLNGCGKSSGKKNTSHKDNSGPVVNKPEVVTPQINEATPIEPSGAEYAKNLIGSWSLCESTVIDEVSMYRNRTISFRTDGTLTTAVAFFDDNNCLQKKTEFYLPEIERLVALRIAIIRLIGGSDEKSAEEEITELKAEVAAVYSKLSNGAAYYGTFVTGEKTVDAHYGLDLLYTGDQPISRFTSYSIMGDELNISKTCIQTDIEDQTCYNLIGQDSENRPQYSEHLSYRKATTDGLDQVNLESENLLPESVGLIPMSL